MQKYDGVAVRQSKEIILKPLSGSDLYETHLPLATFLVF